MDEHVKVWDLEKDKKLYNFYHPCLPKTVSLSSLGHLLVTAGSDCLIRLYDLRRVTNEDGFSVQNFSRTNDYFVAPSPFVEKPNTRYAVLRGNNITVWDNVTGTKVDLFKYLIFSY